MQHLLAGVGGRRLLIGLGQGLALYLLALAATKDAWPATQPVLFAPLFLATLYAPLAALVGLGRMASRRLIAWTVLVAVVFAALAVHDIHRRIGAPAGGSGDWWGDRLLWPSPVLIFVVFVGLFIAHTLVAAAEHDGRTVAAYPTYFDIASSLGVQAVFAVCFVGAMWAVLGVGAALFGVLKLDFFGRLLASRWFGIPATTLAVAAAIHLTDVSPAIIHGIRKVGLMLLSWLLPLLAAIAAMFLVALAATSVDLLWQTRHGAEVVLTAAAGLVALGNAAYQQGPPRDDAEGHRPARLLAWSGLAVGPLTLVLVGLAATAVRLRVAQYGWTTDRVLLAAVVAVAAVFAIGYTVAGPWGSTPRRRWEQTNLVAAVAALAILLALSSPLADPSRIAVASQVARLQAGKVAADKFDFHALRFDGQRYGQEALSRLAAGDDTRIRELAAAALKETNRWQAAAKGNSASPDDLAGNITVHPTDPALSAALVRADISAATYFRPFCFLETGHKCDAIVLPGPGGGRPLAVVLTDENASVGLILQQGEDGKWVAVATAVLPCPEFRAALLAGTYKLEQPAVPDFRFGDQLIRSQPLASGSYSCKPAKR